MVNKNSVYRIRHKFAFVKAEISALISDISLVIGRFQWENTGFPVNFYKIAFIIDE